MERGGGVTGRNGSWHPSMGQVHLLHSFSLEPAGAASIYIAQAGFYLLPG